MGSYKWGYKSPNMGYNYNYPTYNPTRELGGECISGREGA